jgi:1,4-dihydroxy-2-naphthoate octaprenyltransferase
MMNIVTKLFRLTRIQFIPAIIAPVVIGAAIAWSSEQLFNPLYLLLSLGGSVLLHLASNTVDDIFDYKAGVDKVSNEMFPPDFPGWKVIPRGVVTLGSAKIYSYVMFVAAAAIALFFTLTVGYWVIVLVAAGVFLGYFYTAPPLRLDFRGKALGEISIFLSFGLIPVLGSYYVQTGELTLLAAFISIPSGILTITVRMNHDQIFFEPYVKTGKRTLTIILGRENGVKATIILNVIAQLTVAAGILIGILPLTSLIAYLALPLIIRQFRLSMKPEKRIPDYAEVTQATFIANITFSLLLAAGLFL